jgi:exonuclease III
MCEYFCIQETK